MQVVSIIEILHFHLLALDIYYSGIDLIYLHIGIVIIVAHLISD